MTAREKPYVITRFVLATALYSVLNRQRTLGSTGDEVISSTYTPLCSSLRAEIPIAQNMQESPGSMFYSESLRALSPS